MKRLKCLVVDDEIEGINTLKSLIKKRHDLLYAGGTQDAREVLAMIQKYPVELVFVDLHMPHIHGLDLIRLLVDQVEVVCCSADRVYGAELFELGIAFYLTKPVKPELFHTAIDRVWQSITQKQSGGSTAVLPIGLEDYVMFKVCGGSTLNLQLIDIECLEAQSDNTIVTHTDGSHIISLALADFERLLPAEHFIRVHRGCIVAFKNIASVDNACEIITLRNSASKEVPIGRTYKANVRDMLNMRVIKNR
ncbi:LytR/AlgR family response regulator transcription factor [Sphingobacterium paucimobilis]|uniref:Response regulatory domain-containing protein n=1 Tax=Sphingobacterium paucimobilis HER1398 TaxID=1346330 RepID=U2HU33_9SPHI|nr:LytTR family DNA-binding domain-containing protein [Sphingobacterium paucimobilis]ERJ58790.1 hypothetical protein M472_08415 [Sphingobacterium paucimobilis HER1398]